MTTPESHLQPAGDLDRLRATITTLMTTHRVPGLSIAVTSSAELLHTEAFGWADVAAARRTTPETGYLWFSTSKSRPRPWPCTWPTRAAST